MVKREGPFVLPIIVADRRVSRTIPVALGLAMLAVVVAAGLFPNAGTVQAQSTCPYGGCTTSSSLPTWELVSILVVIAAGVIAAALFLMRRRRRPPAPAVRPWQETPPAGAGPAAAAPGGPTPPYVETPEDVGHAPPVVSPPAAAGAAAAVAAPAAAEPDIDSLMAELDKISGEILKKPPKKGAGSQGEPTVEDEEKTS
jgi:hypothetical protein